MKISVGIFKTLALQFIPDNRNYGEEAEKEESK